MNNIETFPLCWPFGYPRISDRKNSRFKITLAKARDYVLAEIKRMQGTDAIISTNIPTNKDGQLRGDWARYKIDDPGVSVYFKRFSGDQVVLCCDKYERVWENLYAIGRAIEALRQIDRDGVSDFLNRAFTGFTALPENTQPVKRSCWEILGISITDNLSVISKAYKEKCKIYHPDMGGTVEQFQELQNAYMDATSFNQQ